MSWEIERERKRKQKCGQYLHYGMLRWPVSDWIYMRYTKASYYN